MQLTKNFALNEFERSVTADRLGIDNSVPAIYMEHVQHTAEQLQKIRDLLGQPITITSGFRSKKLNDALVGSSKTSDHLTALAVDIRVKDMSPYEVARKLEPLKESLKIDQLILEYGTWVHIGFGFRQRHESLTFKYDRNGKTLRLVGLIP